MQQRLKHQQNHTYFDVNYSQLKACGEEYDNKMPTLWQAYEQAGDATLVSMPKICIQSMMMANYQQHLITSN